MRKIIRRHEDAALQLVESQVDVNISEWRVCGETTKIVKLIDAYGNVILLATETKRKKEEITAILANNDEVLNLGYKLAKAGAQE